MAIATTSATKMAPEIVPIKNQIMRNPCLARREIKQYDRSGFPPAAPVVVRLRICLHRKAFGVRNVRCAACACQAHTARWIANAEKIHVFKRYR
jgi:hypothetical protein